MNNITFHRCIEQPLDSSMCISDNCTSKITNLQEAVNFLQMELLEKELGGDFETKIKDFLYVNKDLNYESIQTQRDLVYNLYTDCLRILLEKVTSREKVLSSRHYYWSIRVSLETYILYILRHVLLKSLSAGTAAEDAALNKITRNLNEVRLDDLRIRPDLQSRVDGGRLELSRLDCFVTVLGKIECLRRTVNYISRGTSSVSSDDLLPVLMYLVIKAGLSNWTAQLAFMQQFRFSAKSNHDTDEGSFLITSLEAAIEHIKSGAISRNLPHPEFKKQECADPLMTHNAMLEQSLVERLFACIENGDLTEVKRILAYNESKQLHDVSLCHPLCTCASCEQNWAHQRDLKMYPKDDRGLTPLHVAVLCNQIAIVNYLLDYEIDIDVADSDGLTALHHACIRGHQGILLHMVHANADPTVTDTAGNTPLHCATDRGHESCVKVLLYLSEQMKVPVDVNAVNDNGDTALHLAAKLGYVAIVRILLECGANCKLTNQKGQTPLMVTYSRYIGKLLEYYANVCTDSLQPRRSSVALSSQAAQKPNHQSSASHPEHRAIDRLLAAIVEGDTCLACYYLGLEVYRERLPDLRCAVGMCHPLCDCERCSAIGETLLERCKRRRALAINACNSLGETALHVASATGRAEMVRLLLDAGANVNVTTSSEGRTPLHLACLNGNVDLVKLLLNCATCYVDAQDYDGNTALHLVSQAGNARLVGLLLRHGANVDARNRHDMTPLRQLELEMSGVLTANYADVLKMLKRNSPQPAQSSFDE